MRVRAELYGQKLNTENNITDAFVKNEFQILLTFLHDDKRSKVEVILTREEVESLLKQIDSSINAPEVLKAGFRVV